jgi:hypothetical protein
MGGEKMNIHIIRNVTIVTIIYTVFNLVLGSFRGEPILADYITMILVSGLLLVWVYGWLSQRLEFPLKMKIFFIWAALFVIMTFSNMIEYYFFSEGQESVILSELGVGFIATLIYAIVIGLLFTSKDSGRKLTFPIKKIAIASILYFPIYLAFGMMIFPFVGPFYNDPSLGLNLTIPGLEIIPLQLLRGFLYVLVLIPFISIFTSENRSKKQMILVLTAMLFIPGAFVNFFTPGGWPAALKFYHSIEILADYAVFSAVISWVFLGKKE